MPAAFDVIRVACRQSYAAVEDQVNVLHFQVDGPPTPNTDNNTMQEIGTLISTAFAEVDQLITSSVAPIDLSFYNVTQDAPLGVTSWPAPYAGGTASGEAMPPHDTALVLFNTSVKRSQGRIYLPSFTEAAQTGGFWSAAVDTAVDSFASVLLQQLWEGSFGGTYTYGIYRRSDGAMAFPNSARLALEVAVQRRRKRGRGS